MPVCSTYKDKMKENISKSYTTSEQHKGTSSSRIARDKLDTQKVISYYKKFTRSQIPTPILHNIANGVRQMMKLTYVTLFLLGEKYWKRRKAQKYLQYHSKNEIKSKL